MANEELEALKAEATELGISFNTNISAAKLQEKINAHYEVQEASSEKELNAMVEATEKAEVKSSAVQKNGPKPKAELARELYEEAKKTHVVTIIDNDQRVNNQTTTCKANWTNNFYDMGTRTFPLNMPIEIPQGYIDVLKEVYIPHHVKDPKTGLSITSTRSRFTISYENMK